MHGSSEKFIRTVLHACVVHLLNSDEIVNTLRGDRRLIPCTSIRDRPERGEEQEILRGESGGLSCPSPHQNDSTQDVTEAKKDFLDY